MIRPGVIALLLIVLMSIPLGIHYNKEKAILDDAYSQVVVVICGKGYGTGWFIDHSHVITANHVVESCSNPVLLRDPWSSNATVIARDPNLDVALLEVRDPPSWAEGLPLSYSVSIGDDVYVVGYPIQLYQEVNESYADMSRVPRVQKASVTWINPDKKVFEFSPGTDAGNSGGPIISTSNGGVVGIVVYARSGVVSEGFYGLRMDGLARFLESNNVDYRVSGGGNGVFLWLGVGAVVGLVFLALFKSREVGRLWR